MKALFQLGPAGTSGYAKGMMRFAFLAFKNIKPLVDVRLDFYACSKFSLFSCTVLHSDLMKSFSGKTLCIFHCASSLPSTCPGSYNRFQKITALEYLQVCEHGIYSLFDSLTISLNAVLF